MAKNKSLFAFGLIALTGLVLTEQASAQYYKTLPKGVRLGVYRNVTSEVNSSFNQTSSESPYSYELKADVKFLESIDLDTIQGALDLIKAYPEAYEKLNVGTYKIKGKAQVNVDGYGFAYGITNKVTTYMAMPIYKASVKLDYQRSQGNNYQEVAGTLQNIVGDDIAQNIGEFIDDYSSQLDVDGSFIQNLATNGFGYKEVGDWEGSGLGDIELGLLYNFHTTRNYGLLISGGIVTPTGRVDDPDILQDISFGDGQWDLFAEFGGSYHLTNRVALNTFARYTYQFASDKTLRVPLAKGVNIGDETQKYEEKLGNKLLTHVSTDYSFNDWAGMNIAYEFETIEQAQYRALDSNYAYSEDFLSDNTDSSSHNLRLTGELTTVGLYQQKKFMLPGALKFIYQTALKGRNTPKVDRYEVEVRMYF